MNKEKAKKVAEEAKSKYKEYIKNLKNNREKYKEARKLFKESIIKDFEKYKKSDPLRNVRSYSDFKTVVGELGGFPEDIKPGFLGKGIATRQAYKELMIERFGYIGAIERTFMHSIKEAFIPVSRYSAVRIPLTGEITSEMYRKFTPEAIKFLESKGIKSVADFNNSFSKLSASDISKFESLNKVLKLNKFAMLNYALVGLEAYLNVKSGEYDFWNSLPTAIANTTVNYASWEIASSVFGLMLGGAGVGGVLGLAASLPISFAATAVIMPGIEQYYKLNSNKIEKYRGLRKRGFNMGIVDTRMAATMRQASLQAIQKSHMTAREFVLGNEATILQRTL